MGVFDQDQKRELGCMGDDGDEQDLVACRHQRYTVVTSVADRVHRVGGHLEDAIKGQLPLEEVEEIPPVPGEIFYHAVGI